MLLLKLIGAKHENDHEKCTVTTMWPGQVNVATRTIGLLGELNRIVSHHSAELLLLVSMFFCCMAIPKSL